MLSSLKIVLLVIPDVGITTPLINSNVVLFSVFELTVGTGQTDLQTGSNA